MSGYRNGALDVGPITDFAIADVRFGGKRGGLRVSNGAGREDFDEYLGHDIPNPGSVGLRHRVVN